MANPMLKSNRGPEQASKVAIGPKALTVMRYGTRMIRQRLHCLKPNLQTVDVRTQRNNAWNR
jgi:hypothetical protein